MDALRIALAGAGYENEVGGADPEQQVCCISGVSTILVEARAIYLVIARVSERFHLLLKPNGLFVNAGRIFESPEWTGSPFPVLHWAESLH